MLVREHQFAATRWQEEKTVSDGDDLYVDTAALTSAADDLNTIANALAAVSDLASTALTNLADYDTPTISEEIKSALLRWINSVGDPNQAGHNDLTMISRMRDFATFLQQVAGAYTA